MRKHMVVELYVYRIAYIERRGNCVLFAILRERRKCIT